MKSIFYESAGYTICKIDMSDWEAYRDFIKRLDPPEHYKSLWQSSDIDRQETYKELARQIQEENGVLFALWHDSKIVGQTMLFFKTIEDEETAIFAASEIANNYRRQGLSAALYEARNQYLNHIEFTGKRATYIKPDNTPSLKAAEKNGFIQNGTDGEFLAFVAN